MADRVIERMSDHCAIIKTLSCNEMLVGTGPLPHADQYPSCLILEALVQAALALAGIAGDDTKKARLSSVAGAGMLVAIHSARIHRLPGPGDVLRISAKLSLRWGELLRFTSRAETVDRGELVAEGEFTISTGTVAPAGPPADWPEGAA
jgi:3-hydroxymyristoyl/3-hydroxydecanoyl-(acyl carrier protein) dehydratase